MEDYESRISVLENKVKTHDFIVYSTSVVAALFGISLLFI